MAPSRSSAGAIGRIARELMVDTGCAGQVLAVVSRAVYLRTDGGEILWLTPVRHGTEDGTRHARGVACAYDGQAMRAGMAFASRDGLLRMGGSPALDLRDAVLWSPRPVSKERAARRELARERAASLTASLPSPAGGESRPAGFDAIAADIAEACVARDAARILMQCRELVGLGPGLTPSGDDWVGGLLFVAWHLEQAYSGCIPWDRAAVQSLLRWAGTQTNAISHCILGDLARGDGPACLHDLVFVLLAAGEDGEAMRHAMLLRRLGSSTGREMLAGALTSMLLLSDPLT